MLFGLLQRHKYKLVFRIKLIKLSTFLLTDFSGDSPVVQDSELGWQHLAKLYPHRAAQNRLLYLAKLIRSCTCAAPVHRSEHKKTPTISDEGFDRLSPIVPFGTISYYTISTNCLKMCLSRFP